MKFARKELRFAKMANSLGASALKSGDYPCGCVIVKNGKIVAKAKSQEVNKFDVTAHAETLAISKACRKLRTTDLGSCVLYANIEPCLMCAQAIMYAGIKKVVYGTEHGEYGKLGTFDILRKSGLGRGIKIIHGVEKDRARALLELYFKKRGLLK